MDNSLNSIIRCLHERYLKKYPNRYVEVEPKLKDANSELCVFFRHSNHPYRPYLRIAARGEIVLEKRVKTKEAVSFQTIWEVCGKVSYEDPQMEENLDLAVAMIVETTSQIETCESGGKADTVVSKTTA